MRYRIHGAYRTTGREANVEIEASSEAAAINNAARQGILVERCALVAQATQAAQPREKTCPYCGENIKLSAVKCRFCNTSLVPVPVSYAAAPAQENSSAAGRTCSVLSVIFGAVAFLFCPPLFGIAGLVLGIIGVSISRDKGLGVLGICLSIIGTIVAMAIGAAISLSSL